MAQTSISVVVAAWRDAAPLGVLLGCLDVTPDVELVVATAADEPREYEHLKAAHPRVRWVTAPRGRASQMNAGAASARGEWLLFIHADSRLPDPLALDKALASLRTAGTPRLAGHFALVFPLPDRERSFPYYLCEVKARLGLPGTIHGDQGFLLTAGLFSVPTIRLSHIYREMILSPFPLFSASLPSGL